MKKLVSVLVALAMIFAMGIVAFAAETIVTDEAGLKAAFAEGKEIVLGNNITVTSTLEVHAGKTVSIDLAGYDITATGIKNLIHVANTATLNISDNSDDESGLIELTTTGNGSTINVEGKLNLYSGTISFDDDTSSGISYGVEVQPNAWGTEYTEGTVFNMYGGSIISDTYGIRVASFSSEAYDNISATFVMEGGEISSSWACIFVQQTNETYDKLTVNIKDGKVTNIYHEYADEYPNYYQAISIYGPAATGTIGDVETPTNITVSGGEFLGSITVSNDIDSEMKFEISGGTFSDDVSEFIKDGYLVDEETGEVRPYEDASISSDLDGKEFKVFEPGYFTVKVDINDETRPVNGCFEIDDTNLIRLEQKIEGGWVEIEKLEFEGLTADTEFELRAIYSKEGTYNFYGKLEIIKMVASNPTPDIITEIDGEYEVIFDFTDIVGNGRPASKPEEKPEPEEEPNEENPNTGASAIIPAVCAAFAAACGAIISKKR